MDLLQWLTERLAEYRPVVIRNNGDIFTDCRLLPAESEPSGACGYQTIWIVRGEAAALTLGAEVSNCLFVIEGDENGPLRQCAVSVVLFPTDTDAEKLYEDVSRYIPDIVRYLKGRQVLETAFFGHTGLKQLLSAAEQVVDAPIAVFDIASSPVEMGPRFKMLENDAAVREYREKGFISWNFSENNRFRDFLRRLESATRPFTYHYGDTPLLTRRIYKIYLNGTFVAHCSVVLVHELRELDDELMELLCQMVCRELKCMNYNPYQNDRDSVILGELLTGVYKTEYAFQARTKLYGWTLHGNLYVLNVPRLRETGSLPVDSPFIPTILMRELSAHIAPQAASVRYLIEKKRVLLLVDMEQPGLMESARPQMDQFLREGRHLCALSRRFSSILDFARQVDQTEILVQSAAMAGTITGLVDGNSHFFQRITYVTGREDLENYCLPEVLELRSGDQAGQELLETAYRYLEAGRSVKEAAAELFIHRNTLLRRLAKFREMTGLDLERGEDASKLYLSYRLTCLQPGEK